jgi:Ca-activated chloride channel family protein
VIEFRFAHPWAFALLAVGGWLIWRRYWRADGAAVLYSDLRLTDGLPRSWRVRLAPLPDILRAGAWLLLLIALARPQTGQAREVLRGQGIDIVIALDISGSMAALDFQPDNRLEVAKQVIAEFVAGRSYDRVGVVVFARNAYHLVPLTLDYTVLQELLSGIKLVTALIDPSGVQASLDGTAAGTGIASAAAMMRDSQARSKVIILFTDGATNEGLDPVMAAEAAHALGITVYAVGIGMPGDVPFPEPDGTIITVPSDLDEETLQRVTETGGGRYFRATDAEGLREITAQIDRLERSPVQRQTVVPWKDQSEALLLFAVAALLIERLLRLTVLAAAP